MIEVKEVSCRLKNRVILDQISLHLQAKKCYGFVGHNGCGKTMLFRAIAGLLRYTDGEVLIDGKKIGHDIDFIGDCGTIIGETAFINHLSGYDNLLILAQIRQKISSKEIEEAFAKVGLSHAMHEKYKNYSLGMKQRLRIAQAIMEDPKVLILDEPFNGLDKQGTKEIQDLLLTYKKRGKTILLTSHDERDIERLCDEVFEMSQGRLQN